MSDMHDRSLDLTERALDALDHGDNATADQLLQQAQSLDSAATAEVIGGLDEAGGPEDEDEEDDNDDDDDDDDDEDEEEDDVPGIDEEEDEDPAEEDEEE